MIFGIHKTPTWLLLSLPNMHLGSIAGSHWHSYRSAKSRLWKVKWRSGRGDQRKRFSNNGSSNIICSADMRVAEIRQFCELQDEGQGLMRAAMSQLNLSLRAYHHILKLARKITDLGRSDDIQSAHLAEALQHRPKIMMGWWGNKEFPVLNKEFMRWNSKLDDNFKYQLFIYHCPRFFFRLTKGEIMLDKVKLIS